MSEQLEAAVPAGQERQSRAWIARQPWYVKALAYGLIGGWLAACMLMIGIAFIAGSAKP